MLFLLLIIGTKGDQEGDLQTGWEVSQGVQADVQAWGPPQSHGSQSWKLLCASRAQTCLCHQNQRVSRAQIAVFCVWNVFHCLHRMPSLRGNCWTNQCSTKENSSFVWHKINQSLWQVMKYLDVWIVSLSPHGFPCGHVTVGHGWDDAASP